MGIVRRHKRVTVSGRVVTVRQHTRDYDSGPDGNERRPAAEDAAPAPRAAALPPPAEREDAETWWADDEPRPEPWMDDSGEPEREWAYCDCAGSHRPGCPNDKPGGLPPLRDDPEPEPEHSPAFAAMLEQNPSLGEGYGEFSALRHAGYDGPVNQDGDPTDRKALRKARKKLEHERLDMLFRFERAPTRAERDAVQEEMRPLTAKLKVLEDPRERRRQERARQARKDLYRKLNRDG